MNALVPGSGMADMFVRNAGTGIARGLVNSPSGPQRVGGRGDPAGAMPTRKFGSTRESVGELKSGFKDWLVDPLQAKKEKREQARDTALAVRLGITGGEYSLTHRPAMSLIKKRSGDVQTNIMILQFRVQQFMARNLSAIASTLGVQKSKIGHEEPDPNRSWFGSLLSSIHKDLQENKVFSTLESVGKHIVNIGSILNPFTMGARAKSGVKSFGEFIQKLAMGKEGYEMMKDPTKLYEKAGLKQDFQTKSLNLMKINNEYQRHQLNMLYNLVNISKEILGTFGGSYKDQTLDLVHDEFDGSLKTGRQLRQAQGMRELALHTTMQAASRKSIVGKIGGIFGGLKNLSYDFAEKVSPSKATDRDKYALDYMYNTPGFFEDIRGLSSRLDRFIEKVPSKLLDWYDSKNQSIADRFKQLIEEAISQPNLQPDEAGTAEQKKKKLKKLKSAYQLSKKQAVAQVGFGSSYNATKVVNNLATGLTGRQAADIGKGEARNKYNTYLRSGGDFGIAGIHSGAPGENVVAEYHKSGVIPTLLRSIPVFGAIFGAAQQHQVAGLASKYDEALRSPRQEPNLKKMFGYTPISNGIGFGPGSGSGVQRLMNVRVEEISSNITDKFKAILEDAFVGFSVLLRAALEHAINNNLSRVLGNAGRNVVKTFFDRVKEIADKNQDKYAISVIIKGPAIPIGQTTQRGSTQNQPQGLPQSPSAHAHGNVFSGGNISDYSGQIVSRPTFFNYDELHKFAQGAGVMGEGDKPEGIFPLERNKKGDLGISAPSIMRVILVDTSGKPLSISLPQNQLQTRKQIEKTRKLDDKSQNKLDFKPLKTGFDSQLASLMRGASADSIIHDLSYQKYFNENFMARKIPLLGSVGKLSNLFSGITGTQPKEKKQIDENDNTTTTAERQKSIEEKQEKKEEEKKEQKQEANEEEKKTLLQRIADYINPESKFNKLREKLRKKKEEDGFSLGSLFGSISGMIPDFMKKLGIGLLGAGLLKLLPDGGKEIIKSIFGFAWDSIKYVGGVVWDLLKEHGPGLAKDAWEAFKEHPLIGAGLITTMFPGTVGMLISKIGIPIIKRFPLATPLVLGFGAMAYNLYDSFSNSKDENGSFSFGKFVSEFFIGSGNGLGNIIGKAGTYGLIGAKIGAMFGGVGAIPGFIAGAAIGGIIGGTTSTDENGKFNFGVFLKNFFTGNDAKGGFENAKSNALKWGLIGASVGAAFGGIGAIPGLLIGAAFGGILGGLGSEKIGNLWDNKWESGKIVAETFKWQQGSYAYRMATSPIAQYLPYVGPFIWGAIGSIIDLGSIVIDKIKDYMNPSNWFKDKNVEEYNKKAHNERSEEIEFKDTIQVDDMYGGYNQEYNRKVKVTKDDLAYINAGKTKEDQDKRKREVVQKNENKDRWAKEAGSKYDIGKYIALKEKWEREDAERNKLYMHDIDIPSTNISGSEAVVGVINDFKTTRENAEQYNQLINDNKTDEAIRFAKGIKNQQDEEERKRKSERESALKKIEVGSSPEELQMDAQRKASSAPAAMAAVSMEQTPQDVLSPNERKKEFQQKLSSALSAMYPNVDSEAGEDNQGTGFDIKDTKTKIAEDKTKSKELKFDYAKLNQIYLNTEAASNESAPKSTQLPNNEPKKSLKFDFAKYNQQALAIPAGAEFGATQITKENYNPPQATMLGKPTSAPAAEKAKQDALKSQQQTTQPVVQQTTQPVVQQTTQPVVQQGDPTAGTPQDTSGNQSTTPGQSGELNWIEKIISNTIQDAFKVGGFIADVAQRGASALSGDSSGNAGGLGVSGPSSLSGNPQLDDIGWLSSHRESNGNRSLVAYDDGGGTSYGKYQFASKRGSESMVDFLRWAAKSGGEQGKKLHDFMAQSVGGDLYKLNTGSNKGAPVDAWKKAVSSGMVGDLDEKYMRARFYDKALSNLSPEIQNMVKGSKTLAQVLVSTAVQHGENKVEGKGAPWIFQQAYKPGISVEDFIKNIYVQRKIAYHGPKNREKGVFNRYKEEAGEALALYAYEKNPNAGFAGTGQGALQSGGSTNVPSKVFPGAPKISQQLLQSWQISPSEKLVWPAQSEVITSPMGPRHGGKTSAGGSISSWHRGIDVRARQGDPIFAAMSGKVTGTSRNYGQVKIDHGNGWTSRYLHMSGFNVKPGQTVNAGDTIGAAGGIGKGGGSVYTPHLHFEMHKNGQFVDPEGVYYMYGKGGGHTTYDRHSYNGIAASRQIQAKIGVGGDEDDRGSQLNKSMSKFLSTPNTSSNTAPMKLSDKIGVGGDENYRGDQIRSSMNDYLSETGGDESTKSNVGSGIISELKRVQVLLAALIKTSGKPSIAVSAPQQSGGGNPQNQVDESGASDAFTDSAFSQIGGLLPNLNVSMTGLGTSIA